ncbi:hypothetical protein SAMN05661044_00086 [Olivibacter domesticus]|uniref:Uncharacterized protein n=1 Tax=Olivibacter domesticus TaxID=407022 RepID=A0A1H7GHG8_OLID1|nr:hypothetical protein SAMN05661044_00086 [Olivibacter domesticus]
MRTVRIMILVISYVALIGDGQVVFQVWGSLTFVEKCFLERARQENSDRTKYTNNYFFFHTTVAVTAPPLVVFVTT